MTGEMIRQLLERVSHRVPMNVDYCVERILDGRYLIFIVNDRSLIMACMTWNDGAFILAAAGDMKPLLTYLPKLEQWFKKRGAHQLQLSGRDGWKRVLASHGYQSVNDDFLRKAL